MVALTNVNCPGHHFQAQPSCATSFQLACLRNCMEVYVSENTMISEAVCGSGPVDPCIHEHPVHLETRPQSGMHKLKLVRT